MIIPVRRGHKIAWSYPHEFGVHPDRIPNALKCLRRWMPWGWGYRHEPDEAQWTPHSNEILEIDWSRRDDAREHPKPTKIPYSAAIGEPYGSSTRPTTWTSFDEALWYACLFHPDGRTSGVGFALFGASDLVGIDLDHCLHVVARDETRRIETVEWAPWALDLLATLPPEVYCERSPSGTGLRLIVRGRKPGLRCRVPAPDGSDGAIEMYDGSRGRYVTVTGDVGVERADPGRILQVDLTQFWEASGLAAAESKSPKSQVEPPASWAPVMDAVDPVPILKRLPDWACELWHGRGLERFKGDRSRADWNLCRQLRFKVTSDPAAIYQILMSSGCALQRPKWQERRNDTDYIRDTILRACNAR